MMEEKEFSVLHNPKIEEIYLDLEKKCEKGEDIFDTLVSLIDLLIKSYDFKTILNVIEDNFKLLKNDAERLKIINKKITALLKLEEYNELLKTIEYKESIPNLDNVEKTNSLLYKAVALEALDEIDLAIKTLEDITDNISRYTLVNKYLKLSLLYIEVKRYTDAKKAYDYASLIDHSHKNEMFLLVESDLYYISDKYLEALDCFQSFFLRSPNKYKYLDRYININIKLGNYLDAYNFYLSYKDRPSLRLSSSNKYKFYKSVKELLIILKKDDELFDVNSILEDLKPIYFKHQESEIISLIKSITLSLDFPLTKYDKYKNIVNRFFKLLNSLDKNILVFVEKENNGYQYSIYKGKELKPKEIPYSILKEKNLIDFFNREKDIILDYYYDYNLEKNDEIIKVYSLKTELHDYGYFFVSYNSSYDAVYSTLKDAIKASFKRLDELVAYSNISSAMLNSLSSIDYAFMNIKSDIVTFYDNLGPKLFGLKNSTISYNEFKGLMKDKDIYPDDFLKNNKLLLSFTVDDKVKLIEFNSKEYNNTIYSLVIDVSTIKIIQDERYDFYYNSGYKFYNTNKLREIIKNDNISYALIGLDIRIVESSDSMETRREKLDYFYNYLLNISKESIFFYLGDNHFLLYSYKIDKRILEGIYNKIASQITKLYKYSYTLRDTKVTGFMSKALKNKTYDEVSNIIEYGFDYADLKNDFIILESAEKRNYFIYKAYNSLVSDAIKSNNIKIDYLPIIDPIENKIHYFYTKLKVDYDIPFTTIEKIIIKNSIETKTDYNLVFKILENAKKLNKGIRYLIPLHKDTIVSLNAVKKITELFNSTSFLKKVYFVVELENNNDFLKGIETLKNNGFSLALIIKDIKNFNLLKSFDILLIDINSSDDFLKYLIQGFKNESSLEIVTLNKKIDNCLLLKKDSKIYSFDELSKF